MKKVLFSAFAMITLSLFCTNICVANNEIKTTNSVVEASSTRNVDVWHISGSGKTVKYKVKEGGVYDSNACTLTVGGKTYSVQYNPEYQKSNGDRGKYEYYANGVYYFNL